METTGTVNDTRSLSGLALGRTYVEEVFNRSTGEMETVSLGQWVTVTEFGQLRGMGPRKVRTILRHLDFLAVEGGGQYQRHRITRWAVERGFGKRIERSSRVQHPFDVISPEGRRWLEEKWSGAVLAVDEQLTAPLKLAGEALTTFQVARNRKLDVQEAATWLIDHFNSLTHEEIARILDVTRQLVCRYANIRSKQLREKDEMKRRCLPSTRTAVDLNRDELDVSRQITEDRNCLVENTDPTL
ncbi:MAG TPA: hypothetical protein VNX29_17860 [Kaistia sp.]|nr:hypothetical protein [Kaistia sp.]